MVAGREDATFPVAETQAMADAIPGAEMWVVEDGAHLVALELPEVVTPRIADFLARHD
ncbi:alpha/beta fold hydrolase [Aeromicrobium alkaliterrae]|uniref:alpha/beta fold hydrolase n=1 Tax=Aeromicrobium alkaliterrae TaxID=302168 RepID=UPI003CD064A3